MERGHLSFLHHIWSQGLCRGELLFMQPRIKYGSEALRRRHSPPPTPPLSQTYCLFITITHSVWGLLLQISSPQVCVTASRPKVRLNTHTHSPLTHTHTPWLRPHPHHHHTPSRTRRWAGWGNIGLKGLVAITWGFTREGARHGQLCAWAGPHSHHHQEAVELQGPSEG